MANFNILTLNELLPSEDETIKRNSISIKKQLGKLEDEFYRLRQDDPDFAITYEADDIFEWLIWRGIIKSL